MAVFRWSSYVTVLMKILDWSTWQCRWAASLHLLCGKTWSTSWYWYDERYYVWCLLSTVLCCLNKSVRLCICQIGEFYSKDSFGLELGVEFWCPSESLQHTSLTGSFLGVALQRPPHKQVCMCASIFVFCSFLFFFSKCSNQFVVLRYCEMILKGVVLILQNVTTKCVCCCTGGSLQVCTPDGRPAARHFVYPLLAYVEGACQRATVFSLLLQSAEVQRSSAR